ncbi:cell division protein FtsL [Paracoccus sp. M683]|uniref:cell division protein FtsL n=1 Tax=Paracoccus sp. M683 TaxID=2594268 RepID=UPI00117DB956|nr:cell division protein FtsL [Paracoccus sp. M683]TRW97222.1 cell division protein FtsL [Paracoccus sp. M683]
MRSIIILSCVLSVMGLAFWAYRENYRTQAALDEMRQVQNQIGQLREDLGVLRAEWAYLNRPTRLRELVDLNFERLRLVPIEAGQFIRLAQIDYPAPPPTPPVRPQARPKFISDRAAGLLVPAREEQP